jgi:hypothetical protein
MRDPRKCYYGILYVIKLFASNSKNALRILRWQYLLWQIYNGDGETFGRDFTSKSVFTQANPHGIKCLIATIFFLSRTTTFTDPSGNKIKLDITYLNAFSEHPAVQEIASTIFAGGLSR